MLKEKNNDELNNKEDNETKFSKKLLEALEESEVILQEFKSGKIKGYSNMTELLNSLDDEDDEDE